MFLSDSTVFAFYSKRVMTIMVTRIYEALGSLLSFLCHHLTELVLYPIAILFVLWFLNAQGDPPIVLEPAWRFHLTGELDSVGKGPILVQADTSGADKVTPCCCQEHCQSALEEASITRITSDRPSGKIPQASLRNIQPRTSFLDLRLNDVRGLRCASNRSLQDSIWATPAKTAPASEKTPTQLSYNKQNVKDAQAHHEHEDELCSNKAIRTGEQSIEEKMKAFERKNMGISPWLEDALRAPKNGTLHPRSRRSYPRLRHSVLTWWAGVEQEQPDGELPVGLEIPSELEEYSDCSVQPWDSWSAVVHNLRSANAQDTTTAKMRHMAVPSLQTQ